MKAAILAAVLGAAAITAPAVAAPAATDPLPAPSPTATPAAAAATTAAPAPAGSAAAPAARKHGPHTRYCLQGDITGSRIPRRVCHTEAEWKLLNVRIPERYL